MKWHIKPEQKNISFLFENVLSAFDDPTNLEILFEGMWFSSHERFFLITQFMCRSCSFFSAPYVIN